MIREKDRRAEGYPSENPAAKSECSGNSSQSSSFDMRDVTSYHDVLNPEYRDSSEAIIHSTEAIAPSQDTHKTTLIDSGMKGNGSTGNRSWESESTYSSSSSSTISRKQIYGRSKRTNLIKTSGKNFSGEEQWKSPAERVKLLKKKSLAFRFTQAINGRPSPPKMSEKSNSKAMKKKVIDRSQQNKSVTSDASSLIDQQKYSRPATPFCERKTTIKKSTTEDSENPSKPLLENKKDADRNRIASSKKSSSDDGSVIKSPLKASLDSLTSEIYSPNFETKKRSSQDATPRSKHDEKLSLSGKDQNPDPKIVSPCGIALSVVEGIGVAVQSCIGTQIDRFERGLEINGSTDTLDSYGTLDTTQQQLLHEVNLLNRMNSWETNGTYTTAYTAGTLGTAGTTDTADNTFVSQMPSDVSKNATGNGDNSRAPAQLPTPAPIKQAKKKTKKKTRRQKAVNFQYPPISSMKACPIVTEEERKSLFFTESELDVYENDRSTNICDDVEIVAVEFSDSDTSSSEVEDYKDSDVKERSNVDNRKDTKAETPSSNLKPSIRPGKYSKPLPEGSFPDKPPLGLTEQNRSGSLSTTPALSEKSTSDNISAKSNNNNGKIKGVQIYLRQRSVA